VLCFAQSFGQTAFQTIYGPGISGSEEKGLGARQTQDGGYILLGHSTYANTLLQYASLSKTDSLGNLKWRKYFRPTGYPVMYPNSVEETHDGGFVLMFTDIMGTGFLIKTNMTGDTMWSKRYSGNPLFLSKTSDKGFVLCGRSGQGISLTKLDSAGIHQWSESIGPAVGAGSVRETHDKGYIIAGSTNTAGAGGSDMLVIKTDSLGTLQWAKALGGTQEEKGHGVSETFDKGFVVSGSTTSFGSGGNDAYLTKIDSAGAVVWTKVYGGGSEDIGVPVLETRDSGIAISGYTQSYGAGSRDVFLLKTDRVGNLQWSKTFGGNTLDQANSLQQTLDGGFIVSCWGTSFSPYNYVIKTDSAGNSGCFQTDPPTTELAVQFMELAVLLSVGTGVVPVSHSVTIDSGGKMGKLCSMDIQTSNEPQGEISIYLYPNPASSHFRIETKNVFQEISVYNSSGSKLHCAKANSKSASVNVQEWPSGLYFVLVQFDKYVIGAKFFVQ
jgi:hypothetical protein